MKKAISLLLALIVALSCMASYAVVYSSAVTQELWVWIGNKDVEDKFSDQAISWWQGTDGEYYLFVPSYWDASALKVFTSVDGEVKMGDTAIVNGETYDLGTEGTLTYGGKDYSYNVVASSGVGTVFIETESGSLEAIHADKSHAEAGDIYIYNESGKCQTMAEDESGNKVMDTELKSIKGRGNASWESEKKPYNIKLANKYKLFGMQKSKKWCLIANYDDNTLMRNSVAFGAAADAGMAYTPEYAPIDLYINGEYKGAYIITSKIEADSKRIDVENLDDINEDICIEAYGEDFDMGTLKRGGVYGKYSGLLENTYKYVELPESKDNTTVGGYILEMELANRYADEISGFVTSRSQPVIMKEPEYASKAQMEFISDYYQRFEDAVSSADGKNDKGEAYSDLADLKSLAMYYTYSEWLSNMDSGLTSTYFYIDTSKDGILYAGPVWDYDIALGNNSAGRFGCDYTNPEEFTVAFGRQYRNTVFGSMDVYELPTIYNTLAQREDFAAACKQYWDSDILEAVTTWSGDKFDSYASQVKDSAVMNHIRWNTYGTSDVAAVTGKYEADVAALKEFAVKRTAFIDANIGTVQQNPHATNTFLALGKKVLVGINNMFEKVIVLFHLENK